MVRHPDKHFAIRLTTKFLEEYLFKNKIQISHVDMDHSTGCIRLFFRVAGPHTAEGQCIQEIRDIDLPKALEHIKRCLRQD
jgi:hypothetical protein